MAAPVPEIMDSGGMSMSSPANSGIKGYITNTLLDPLKIIVKTF
jgi:hypothetical protein